MKGNKFWEIKNQIETDKSAEIFLYGPISDESWWGDELTPKQMIQDLNEIKGADRVDVRINSNGGNVFAAHAMATQLSRFDAEIHVYIDGLAASAATIIAMAGDKIYIPPSGTMMIHDPMVGLMGYFNSTELTDFIDFLEKIETSIINSYKSKTGLDDSALAEIMKKETWLVGSEAVELGFADEVIGSGDDVKMSMKGNVLNMNGITFDMSKFEAFDSSRIPKELVQQKTVVKPQINEVQNNINTKTKSESEGDIVNIQELKEKHPDIYNTIRLEGVDEGIEQGVKNERNRIQEIENMAGKAFPDLANKAKFETFASVEKLAVDIVKAQSEAGNDFLKNQNKDIENSGMEGVEGEGTGDPKPEEDEAADVANFMNKKRGLK